MGNGIMQDPKEVAQVLRFQQSLMRLVTRGVEEQAKSKGPVAEQTRQLEVWVRKVRARTS